MTDQETKHGEPTPIEGFDPAPILVEYGLTLKQAYFCEWYLLTLNAAKAARLAGYSKPYHVSGSRALSNVNIRKYLEHRYGERKITASAILDRLTAIAEADISDYLVTDPKIVELRDGVFKVLNDGRVLDGIWIDLKRALKDGNTGAIKSYKRVKGETVIELHDKTRALELLGRHYRMFADVRVESDKPDGTADELSDNDLAEIARQGLGDDAARRVLEQQSNDD